MALTTEIFMASLQSVRLAGGFPFAGINFDRFAVGLALAMMQWAISQPQNLSLTGLALGVPGVGAVVAPGSKLFIPQNVPTMTAALAGAGMAGPLSPSLATVVTLGVTGAFNTAGQYLGPAAGVGSGADVSKVTVSNAGTLVPILMANLSASLGPGLALPQMCAGVGNGIAALLIQGTGTGVVAGSAPPGPPTTSGATTSVVV